MPKVLSQEAVAEYQRDGFFFPIRVMSAEDAAGYRAKLEAYETLTGGPIGSNMRHKVNVLFTWGNEIVRHPAILDVVEDVLGPNILCWSSSFFIKEAQHPGYISFHQDATYWGLDPPDVMTAWLAFTPVTLETGPVQFLPGSHKQMQIPHRDTFVDDNLLTRGQEVEVEVDESETATVLLEPGEISLHHVLLVHGSKPNTSPDRRIGLAVRYMPTHVRQQKVRDSAMLVRGVDEYGYYDMEPEPEADADDDAIAAHADAMERQVAALYSGTDHTEMKK